MSAGHLGTFLLIPRKYIYFVVCFLNLHCIFTGQSFRVQLEMGRLGKALGMTRKRVQLLHEALTGIFFISLCVCVGGSCPFGLGPMVWMLPLI